MRLSRLAAVLLVLVFLPGPGRAQTREGAAEETVWTPYPDTGAAPAPGAEAEAPFEPLGYPGETAASEPPPGRSPDAAPDEPLGFPGETAASEQALGAVGSEPTLAPVQPLPTEAPPAEPLRHAAEALMPTPVPPAAMEAPSVGSGELAREREPSSGPGLLPSSPEPRFSPRLAPEPLAVPLLRSLLDVAGAGAATLGSMVLVELLTGTHCFREQERLCALTAFSVTMLSVSATAPVGAWAVGTLLGGEGQLWAAYTGAALGLGLGFIGTMPTLVTGSGVILAVGGPLGAVLGAAIGYEVSHRLTLRRASLSAERPSGVRVMPVLGATPRGSLLGGLAGSF